MRAASDELAHALGVAQRGEAASDSGNEEGDDDGRPRVVCSGCARQDKNAGAYDAADTDGEQVPRGKGAIHLRFQLHGGSFLPCRICGVEG